MRSRGQAESIANRPEKERKEGQRGQFLQPEPRGMTRKEMENNQLQDIITDENGSAVSWKDKSLKEHINDILEIAEQRHLTPDELGRIWLLCFTEQETAKMEGRTPAYTEKTFSQTMAYDARGLDPAEVLRKQVAIFNYSLLLENLKKAVATADTYAHAAQSAVYAYLYEITEELQHQTAVALALATPIILEPAEYKALTEKAGSTDRKALAETYAEGYYMETADAEERKRRTAFLLSRGYTSGFAIRQDNRPAIDHEEAVKTAERIAAYLGDPAMHLNRNNIRVYFDNYYYSLAYVFHLYRVLQLFSRAYEIPNLEKLARIDRVLSFFTDKDVLAEPMKTLESLLENTGTGEKITLPRFNRELPQVNKKSLKETRERFRDHDPAKDKDFNDYLLEVAKERKDEGRQQLQSLGYLNI